MTVLSDALNLRQGAERWPASSLLLPDRFQTDTAVQTDTALLPKRSAFIPSAIHRPEQLLQIHTGQNPLASIRTDHAGTLFSEGAVVNGELLPSVRQHFQNARNQGITSLYVIGMWETTAFSNLWLQHWAPTWEGYNEVKNWVGPSTFSIDDYVPMEKIGSWENLDIVIQGARDCGIEIMPCFVTNTIGMGGSLMRRVLRENPETMMLGDTRDRREYDWLRHISRHAPTNSYHLYKEEGSSAGQHTLNFFRLDHGHDVYHYNYLNHAGGTHEIWVQMKGGGLQKFAVVADRPTSSHAEEVYKVMHGTEDPGGTGDGKATIWSDVAHRAVHLPETRRLQVAELDPVNQRFPFLRCDMAHLAGPESWRHYPELIRERGHELKGLKLETYFAHGELMNCDPTIATYANYVYNWLVREKMNIPALMSHIHDNKDYYRAYPQQIAYVQNHDDQEKIELSHKGAMALIMISLPVESVLFAQNQLTGDDLRIGAPLHLPQGDFFARQANLLKHDDCWGSHLGHLKFMRRVQALSSKPVFRSPDANWSRAVFAECDSFEQDRIFHIARDLPGKKSHDRVLTVVDARWEMSGRPFTIDLARTFGIAPEELGSYAMVDLISGKVRLASASFHLAPGAGWPAPHSYCYALKPINELNGTKPRREAGPHF